MYTACLLKVLEVASMNEQVIVVVPSVLFKGESLQLRVLFFLIQQPEQYGRIRNDNGHLALKPFDAVRLLRYEGFLIFEAPVQKVELAVPHKLFGVFGDILRYYACFL